MCVKSNNINNNMNGFPRKNATAKNATVAVFAAAFLLLLLKQRFLLVAFLLAYLNFKNEFQLEFRVAFFIGSVLAIPYIDH